MTQSSKKESDTRGLAFYNSDTDDWTLVSPPSSSGGSSRGSVSPESSPERNLGKEIGQIAQQQSQTTQETSTISTEVIQSTSQIQTDNSPQLSSRKEAQTKKQTDHKTSTSASSSKMALDGANRSEHADDADDESDGMTEVNLDENGVAIIREQSITNLSTKLVQFSSNKNNCIDDNGQKIDDNSRSKFRVIKSTRSTQELSGVQDVEKYTDEFKSSLEKVKTPIESLTKRSSHRPEFSRRDFFCSNLIFGLTVGIITMLVTRYYMESNSPFNYYSQILSDRLSNKTFDFLYSDPSNHVYTELKLLNEEIADCIERRNPITLEVAHWRFMDWTELSKYETVMNSRPFKGLVCYENEVKWRKRYNYLKTEFNFDLRKIIRKIKHRLTNDILAKYHPHTPFELVLNQLEYLDHVEQRRKDNALEKLKAENLDLLRRLNNRSFSSQEKKDNESNLNRQKRQSRSTESNDQSSIKSLIILESENVRLRREVESLKSRLAEKAGTVYIKQSIELEKCERENNILKQFHQDVVDEIGKNLLKVGLHKTEAFTYMTTNNKDDDNTSAKLASTRHFFVKLSEEITKLVAKNKDLERDLSEAKMLNALVVREAQNLIEGANQTKSQADDSPVDNNDHTQHINASGDDLTRYREYEPEPGKAGSRFNSIVAPNDASKTEFLEVKETNDSGKSIPHTMHKDWLSKRAHLREQLRQSSRALEQHLSDFRRGPRSISSSSSSSSSSDYEHSNVRSQQGLQNRWEKEPESQYENHQIRQSKSRFNDIEHKRLSSLKRLNKSNKSNKSSRSSSSATANSYNQNSQKNCKSHHKRDEL